MSLASGTRIGPYEVTAKLGEGGMGEVYRARDTKLDRDVAIKVLPESFAADADRVARFTREAKTLASLNHPNIAGIYGIEANAIVMELVEGRDLSELIGGGAEAHALHLPDAIAIARQIADALEAAHEQGIIHRDLKPQNIKVRDDGTVKVLDFGLAKAMDPAGASSGEVMNSPTMTARATQMGMILGTAAYMAPEQAKGKPVDKRADIWAFGVVLYEMLTGRRAFDGEDISTTLAAVLMREPDFTALPASTPPAVASLVRRCLERDPKQRLRDIGEARLLLSKPDTVSGSPTPAAAPRRGWLPVIAALSFGAIAAAAAWNVKLSPTLPVRVLEMPAALATADAVALAPDGARVAYLSGGHLFVRVLSEVSAQDLGPIQPATAFNYRNSLFWSPDGKTVGFSSEGEIRTVPAGGGPFFAVCKIPATGEAIAARWLRDGTIVFAVWRENVYAVPSAGGTSTVAMALDPATEIDVHSIDEVPGDRLIVVIHERARNLTALVSRSTDPKQPRVPISDDATVVGIRYAAPNWLVFGRSGTNSGIWIAPFSAGPLDLAKGTRLQPGADIVDVANDGSLIFALPARNTVAPVWVDRSGAVSAVAGRPITAVADIPGSANAALSPDGRRLAMVIGGETRGEDDDAIVVRDLATGEDTRLTARSTSGQPTKTPRLQGDLTWLPSGDRILFRFGGVGSGGLGLQRSDEAGASSAFAPGLVRGRVSRDGRTLAAIRDDRGATHLVYAAVRPDGSVGDALGVFKDEDPVVGRFDLSPSGGLVVYAVRQPSGQYSVYLSEFPSARNQRLVADDASNPRFSPDGGEIFYIQNRSGANGRPNPTLVSRTLGGTAGALGVATTVLAGESAALIAEAGYDIAPDGRRFVTMKPVPPAADEGRRLMWMQNWPSLVNKK